VIAASFRVVPLRACLVFIFSFSVVFASLAKVNALTLGSFEIIQMGKSFAHIPLALIAQARKKPPSTRRMGMRLLNLGGHLSNWTGLAGRDIEVDVQRHGRACTDGELISP
jgi:hypothetical protein